MFSKKNSEKIIRQNFLGERGNFVKLPRIFELIRFNVVAKKYVHRIWLLWNAYIIII